jgi:hypothetical protein
MTRAQGSGIFNLAATSALIAMAALLAAIPAARADELADLRANQLLLQQRIDQLAQAQGQPLAPEPGPPPPLSGGAGGGYGIGITGAKAAPNAPVAGGSFPRSFLIPGTDTSIRVGGFVDITILDFLNGGGNVDGSNYGSNAGQNGTLPALPLGGGFVPGLGFVNPNAVARAPTRNNGVLEFSPQQSRIDIETRTPTAWGEARTFLAFDWAGCSSGANYTCQTLQQSGGNSLLPRLRFAYGTLGFQNAAARCSAVARSIFVVRNFPVGRAPTGFLQEGVHKNGRQRRNTSRHRILGPGCRKFETPRGSGDG